MVVPKSAVAAPTTLVVALEVLFALFGSGVVEETVPVSVIRVLFMVPALTCSVSGNASVEPEASGVAEVQVMVPVPPMTGMMHDQPAGTPMPWNVVFGGVVSVNDGLAAGAP